MVNMYAEYPCYCADVGGLEMGTYGVLDRIQQVLIISGEEFIIDIDWDNDDRLSVLEDEYGVISMHMSEANFD